MDNDGLEVSNIVLRKVRGASPSEDRFYVLALFDIADGKKYRALIKILNRYSLRIQKSVFEGYLSRSQIGEMRKAIERLMAAKALFCKDDKVRIYVIAGNCRVIVFGECCDNLIEDNIFL